MAYAGPLAGNASLEAVREWAAQKVHSHQISDIANLQTELNGKAPSAHTHVCADVTDLETKLGEYAKKTEIAGVYKYKGSCTWAELIAKTDAALNDVWNVTDKSGMNYGCIKANTAGEASWDALGSITTIDLSGYYTITQTDGTFLKKTDAASTYAPISHSHEISDVNGLQTALDEKAKAADVYTKTESDGKYALKTELPEEMTKEQALAILNGTGA